MLRPEEGHQLHPRMPVEEIHRGEHGVAGTGNDSGVVRDQPHPLSGEKVEALLQEDLGPHPDRRLLRQGHGGSVPVGTAAGQEEEDQDGGGLSR